MWNQGFSSVSSGIIHRSPLITKTSAQSSFEHSLPPPPPSPLFDLDIIDNHTGNGAIASSRWPEYRHPQVYLEYVASFKSLPPPLSVSLPPKDHASFFSFPKWIREHRGLTKHRWIEDSRNVSSLWSVEDGKWRHDIIHPRSEEEFLPTRRARCHVEDIFAFYILSLPSSLSLFPIGYRDEMRGLFYVERYIRYIFSFEETSYIGVTCSRTSPIISDGDGIKMAARLIASRSANSCNAFAWGKGRGRGGRF